MSLCKSEDAAHEEISQCPQGLFSLPAAPWLFLPSLCPVASPMYGSGLACFTCQVMNGESAWAMSLEDFNYEIYRQL